MEIYSCLCQVNILCCTSSNSRTNLLTLLWILQNYKYIEIFKENYKSMEAPDLNNSNRKIFIHICPL